MEIALPSRADGPDGETEEYMDHYCGVAQNDRSAAKGILRATYPVRRGFLEEEAGISGRGQHVLRDHGGMKIKAWISAHCPLEDTEG